MELTKEQYDILVKWIENNLIPWNKINHRDDTSLVRESFMSLYVHGFYLDNPTMNAVLQECGFTPADLSNDPYLSWNISPKSRAIQIFRSSLGGTPKGWRYE